MQLHSVCSLLECLLISRLITSSLILLTSTHNHQVMFLNREFEWIGIFGGQAFRFLLLWIIQLFLLLAISINSHRVQIVYDIWNIFVSSQLRYRSKDFKLFATILISPQIPSAPARFDLRFPETNFWAIYFLICKEFGERFAKFRLLNRNIFKSLLL